MRVILKQRSTGTSDPVFVCDTLYASVLLASLLICVRPVLGISDASFRTVFLVGFGTVFVAAACAQCVDTLRSRRLAQRFGDETVPGPSRVVVAGTAAELERLLRGLARQRPTNPCFRCFLSCAQRQGLAFYLPLVALPLSVFFDVDAFAISMTSIGACFVVLATWFGRRTRYRLDKRVLIVETMSGFQVVEREEVALEGVSVECDFALSKLWIERAGARRPIDLDGLVYPHAFVTQVISEVSVEEPERVPGSTTV